MTNPHNVDICVTCVSEKPPQLPLREELPSLGIEVVYNAQGVGAKASRKEQRKKLKEYRKEKEQKKKNPKGFRALFGRNKQKCEQEEIRRKEEELRTPHALSYNKYNKVLHETSEKKTGEVESQSSWDTGSTADASKHTDNNSGQPQDPPAMSPISGIQPPIHSLEFPTFSLEELAINEAFNVFASNTAEALMFPTAKKEEPVSQGNPTPRDPPIGDGKGKASIESFAEMAQKYLTKIGRAHV